ncbi:response regulator transcription factor [Psychrobacter sp. HD31]|uniref:LuxR C-terminal-related transcriptional regulator n=1 Tax=Psychrobacter sp. HD31 TaxID=3112003 RepID=UPI003DA5812A
MCHSLITLIVADDHQIFLDGLSVLFDKLPWTELQGSANNGSDTLSLIKTFQPDVALVDLSMPGTSIDELILFIEDNQMDTKVIALTMLNDAYRANQLLQLGLNGYVVKDNAFEDLLEAIQEVNSGGQFISPFLIETVSELQNHSTDIKLTNREREILKCIINGDLNKQIAHQLGITERTVCFHLANCFVKLGVSNRTQAVTFAIKNQII